MIHTEICKEYSLPTMNKHRLNFRWGSASLVTCLSGVKKNVSKIVDGFFDFLIYFSFSKDCRDLHLFKIQPWDCTLPKYFVKLSRWELILWNYECNNIYRVSNTRRWLCNYPTNLWSFIFCKLRSSQESLVTLSSIWRRDILFRSPSTILCSATIPFVSLILSWKTFKLRC